MQYTAKRNNLQHTNKINSITNKVHVTNLLGERINSKEEIYNTIGDNLFLFPAFINKYIGLKNSHFQN